VQVTFAGEIDHMKVEFCPQLQSQLVTNLQQNQAKVGLAVQLENAPDELMEQQQTMADVPPPPF